MCVCMYIYIYSGGPRPNDERADGGRPRDKTERIEPGAVFEKCGEQMRLGLVGGEGLSGRNWREFCDGKVGGRGKVVVARSAARWSGLIDRDCLEGGEFFFFFAISLPELE